MTKKGLTCIHNVTQVRPKHYNGETKNLFLGGKLHEVCLDEAVNLAVHHAADV